MKRRRATMGLTLCVVLLLPLRCGQQGNSASTITVTKEQVKAGKADSAVDWCEEMGWYNDGVCDTFCLHPDPDCALQDVFWDAGQDSTSDEYVEDVTDCGDASDEAQTDAEDWDSQEQNDGGSSGWDLALDEATQLTEELVTAKFKHGTMYMGWAHYSNNCFIRMRAVYYYFNFGQLPQYDETEEAAQKEMMKKIQNLQHSVVYEISFDLAGALEMHGKFVTDDEESKPYVYNEFDTTWTNHHAALVYTDQGLRVIDIAFAHKPLTIEEWETYFLPEELWGKCAMNDPDLHEQIVNYNIAKSLGQNPPVPEPRCVFMIKPIFKHDDGTAYDDDELFPFMWNDVHEMEFSAKFVIQNAGDVMYLTTHPEKVPLIRLQMTDIKLVD